MKKGLYNTWYGNTALVSGPKAKRAWDLDMAEWVPISEVNPNDFLREVKTGDYDRRM